MDLVKERRYVNLQETINSGEGAMGGAESSLLNEDMAEQAARDQRLARLANWKTLTLDLREDIVYLASVTQSLSPLKRPLNNGLVNHENTVMINEEEEVKREDPKLTIEEVGDENEFGNLDGNSYSSSEISSPEEDHLVSPPPIFKQTSNQLE